MIALLLGTALALVSLAYVLAPLFADSAPAWPESPGAVAVDVTQPRVIATCLTCGPRPETDALYCSTCGRWLGEACRSCGAQPGEPGARYCSDCGHQVATT